MRNATKIGMFVAALGMIPSIARAEDDRFAAPPPGRGPVVAVDDDGDEPAPRAREPERPRSPVRVAIGPVGVTTGKGMGLGLGGALDIGRGSVGARLSAVWTRGEPGGGDRSTISESFAQYAGELVLDLKKRGPVHPLLGVGFGVIRAENAQSSGVAGVGLLRAGVEYALGFEETDVRLGMAATGGLLGPSDRELETMRAHALVTGYVAIGL